MKIKYYEISLEDKEIIVDKLKNTIKRHKGVAFVYLHGSFPNASRFRDIDIAVYLDEVPVSPLQTELSLETLLSSAVPYPIDVKILNNSPLSFTFNVIKSGIPIFVANDDIRVDFIENTLKKYFDFAPFRKLYLKETLGLEI